MLDLIMRLRGRGTALDIEAAEMLESICASVNRAADLIPKQTPEMIKAAEALKQEAMDRGYFPGTRKRT